MHSTIGKLLFHAVIFSYSVSNSLADWTRLAEDKTGTTIYIDRTTLQRKDDHATLSSLFDYKDSQKDGQVSWRSTKANIEYDCLGKRLRILSMSFHSENMSLGKMIESESRPRYWEPVFQNSMGESSFDYACSTFSTDGSGHRYREDLIPNWQQGPSREDADIFFEPKSIKRTKGKVSMLVIINLKMPIDIKSRRMWSSKMKAEFDCINQSSRYSARTYYELPYGKGAQVSDSDTSSNSWKPLSDKDPSMGMWKIACNR